MKPQALSKLYHACNPVLQRLPIKLQIKLASTGRKQFMSKFVNFRDFASVVPSAYLAVEMWGIKFRSPISNAAGMFKNGEGYNVVAQLGAGSYLGGTSTTNMRIGNKKNGVSLPFINLPQSQLAINWLGLPNLGDAVLANQTLTTRKTPDCPIGWSVMRSPDFDEATGLSKLIYSLWLYHNHPQIDYLEINESCPNVSQGGGSIIARLEQIGEEFIAKRKRHLPVVVKLSNDISAESLRTILATLIKYKFDGVNLGNTSTNYPHLREFVTARESAMFDYFTSNFGGGVSGNVLKERSLELCSIAAEYLALEKPDHEFHIIRSGGIDCAEDIIVSQQHGVSFNQWYTGFFNQYAHHGSDVYQNLYAELTSIK